ncbi:MAG: 2OG-Fe(II) oxygenase family protein [Pseudomonadota bacterium]
MLIGDVDLRSDDAPQRFTATLRETGFAIVRHAPIDVATLDNLERCWRRFFESSDTDKLRHRHDVAGQAPLCGYWPASESERAVGAEVIDLKEFFHVLPGARVPDGTSQATFRYREQALATGRLLLDFLTDVDAAGLARMLSAADSVLRLLHYPPLRGRSPDGALRAAPHEDINLLTVLPVSAEPGLEVMDRDGQWHRVAGRPGEIVVNAGDMLAELSAGRYPSTTHRVVNPDADNTARFAAPLFLTPFLDTVLSSRYTAGAYLAERLQAISGGTQTPARDWRA